MRCAMNRPALAFGPAVVTTMIRPLMTKNRSTPLLPNAKVSGPAPASDASVSKWTNTTRKAATPRRAWIVMRTSGFPDRGVPGPWSKSIPLSRGRRRRPDPAAQTRITPIAPGGSATGARFLPLLADNGPSFGHHIGRRRVEGLDPTGDLIAG